jgi:hypothetical protein
MSFLPGIFYFEGLFLIVPHTLFIILAIFRFRNFRKQRSSLTTPLGGGPRVPLVSFKIKMHCNFWVTFCFLVSCLGGLLLGEDEYWVASYKAYAILMLLPAGAWATSAWLLYEEMKEDLPQHETTHRWFWIVSAVCFGCEIMFPSTWDFFPMIVGVIRLVPTVILAVYAIWKPYDFVTYTFKEDLPPSAIQMALFKIEDQFEGMKIQVNPPEELPENDKDEKDPFEMLKGEGNRRSSDTNFRLKKACPEVKVEVGRSFIERPMPGEPEKMGLFFRIKTVIPQYGTYVSYQNYVGIDDLKEYYTKSYLVYEFPDHQKMFPPVPATGREPNSASSSTDFPMRSQNFEKFLNALFEEPALVTPFLLNFLNIDSEARGEFLAYKSYLFDLKQTGYYQKAERPLPFSKEFIPRSPPNAPQTSQLYEEMHSMPKAEKQSPKFKGLSHSDHVLSIEKGYFTKSVTGHEYSFKVKAEQPKDPRGRSRKKAEWGITKKMGDFYDLQDDLKSIVPYVSFSFSFRRISFILDLILHQKTSQKSKDPCEYFLAKRHFILAPLSFFFDQIKRRGVRDEANYPT